MALFDEDPVTEFDQEPIGDVLGGGSYEVIPDNLEADTLEPEAEEEDSVYSALKEAAEPDSLRKWKQEQEEQIAVRDAEAETKRLEWKAEAAKELETWHAKQQEVLANNKAANREAQAEFLKDTQEEKPGVTMTTARGAQWEKICKLCDFNPKNNRNEKDTARMRSIFLQLKQSPLVR